MHLAELSYPQVEQLLESDRTTVMLFPVGSTEPHGPHSPLSTDPIISMGMCERAAERLRDDPELRAVILPPFGVRRHAIHPGVSWRNPRLRGCSACDARRRLLTSLIESGLSLPRDRQQSLRARACADASPRDRRRSSGPAVRPSAYLDLTRKERATRLTEEFRRGECHAGRYETSLVLCDRPELVDPT